MALNNRNEIYLNPLALESVVFLKKFDKLRDKHAAVDGTLLHILDQILMSVDKFLEEKSQAGLPKPITKINMPNLDNITQYYSCSKCRNSFHTLQEAAIHALKKCKAILPEKNSTNISLNDQAKSLLMYKDESVFLHKLRLAEKLKSLQEYNVINKHLTNSLKLAFPNKPVKTYFFGSRITGISSRGSDIDAYVEINQNFRLFEEGTSFETHRKLRLLCQVLQESKNWKQLLEIHRARIPILKALHVPTGIKCDIGFTNSLSVINTNLLDYLFELQPLARCMCIHFKEWMIVTHIKKVMSSYAMVLMVIFFLQTQKLLPSVKVLQDKLDLKQALTVGPWLATFNCYSRNELGIDVLPVTLSCCRKYMKMFYNYYINFNFNEFMICPYIGEKMEIGKFNDNMPEWYNLYTKKNRKLMLNTTEKRIVIQDPLQLNFNVARNIDANTLAMIIKYMCLSEAIL